MTADFNSPYGRLLITANQQAIRSIQFTPPQQKNETSSHPLLQEALSQLKAFFKGTLAQFDLPLETRGTPFQAKVWDALQNIPKGETRTYQDIAHLLHSPKAARAVGGACNRNPWLIVVPCHRVIGSQGSLVHYVAGVLIKKDLLDFEKNSENF